MFNAPKVAEIFIYALSMLFVNFLTLVIVYYFNYFMFFSEYENKKIEIFSYHSCMVGMFKSYHLILLPFKTLFQSYLVLIFKTNML